MLATRWYEPARALVTAWIGPAAEIAAALSLGTPPQALPAVIGPPGPQGLPGARGDPGPPGQDGNGDPGDLTLYLINGLT